MAHNVIEIDDARGVDLTTGTLSGRRVFVVDIDTAISTNAEQSVILLFGTATTPDALPNMGDPFPEIPQLISVDHRITLVPDMITRWRVEFVYRVQVPIVGPGPGSVGFFDWSVRRFGELVDAWRADSQANPLTIPVGAVNPLPFATQNDIGGDRIDSAGEPTSVPKLTQIWSVSETISLATFAAYGNYVNTISTFVNRRNLFQYYGAPIGSLVYLGGSETHRSKTNIYTYTHEFGYDEFLHMRQVPQRDQNGVARLFNPGPPGPGEVFHAQLGMVGATVSEIRRL